VKKGSGISRKAKAKRSMEMSARTMSGQPPPALRRAQRGSLHPSTMRIRIEAAIRRIPRVSTYGAIARAAGLPGAARLVARVLHRGFGLPWQRVLGAGGEIKLRGDSAIEQRLRLESEGVRFRGRRADMRAHEFKFRSRGAGG